MASVLRNALRLAKELKDFVSAEYRIPLSEAIEQPHVHAFLEHCVSRPLVMVPQGGVVQRPLRRTLPSRVKELATLQHRVGLEVRITDSSVTYARQLADQYVTRRKGALPITPDRLLVLLNAIDTNSPYGKRLRAIILCITQTWARPNEILDRAYPDEILTDYDDGIAFIVPRSKTNPGPKPRIFGLRHHKNETVCAVCALKEWVEWLLRWAGEGYRGPLFPIIRRTTARSNPRPLKTPRFRLELQQLAVRCGMSAKSVSAYSFRKGNATTAASRRAPLEQISGGLRQATVRHTLSYIDPDLLFDLMRNVIE
jgi:hypothetical protein